FPFEAQNEHSQFLQQPLSEPPILTCRDHRPSDTERVEEEHYRSAYLVLSLKIYRIQYRKPSRFPAPHNIPSRKVKQTRDQNTKCFPPKEMETVPACHHL